LSKANGLYNLDVLVQVRLLRLRTLKWRKREERKMANQILVLSYVKDSVDSGVVESMTDQLASLGVDLVAVPYEDPFSSTSITRGLMRENHIPQGPTPMPFVKTFPVVEEKMPSEVSQKIGRLFFTAKKADELHDFIRQATRSDHELKIENSRIHAAIAYLNSAINYPSTSSAAILGAIEKLIGNHTEPDPVGKKSDSASIGGANFFASKTVQARDVKMQPCIRCGGSGSQTVLLGDGKTEGKTTCGTCNGSGKVESFGNRPEGMTEAETLESRQRIEQAKRAALEVIDMKTAEGAKAFSAAKDTASPKDAA
jgi:hypothetical protein